MKFLDTIHKSVIKMVLSKGNATSQAAELQIVLDGGVLLYSVLFC